MARGEYHRGEVHTTDLPVRALEPIGEERSPEIIVATDADLAAKDYLDELAFNEEMLTVVLHKGKEKFAPRHHDFYVNGKAVWIPVDTPVTVARKYVEVMARSQPMDVRTESHAIDDDQSAGTVNNILRSLSSQYPFTVIEDKNPKGRDWLTKVMREN